MKTELCLENPAALDMLRPEKNDRSGIGVHYVDTWLKPLKKPLELADGTKISAKRRGLKISLSVGEKKGEGLMRRITVSRDPMQMLRAALDEAGAKIGVRIFAEDGRIWYEA